MDFIKSIGLYFTFEFYFVLALISLLLLIQVIYYLVVYLKPYKYEKKRVKEAHSISDLAPVSVVIASKNESESLIKNLPAILEQDYPNFEVVVVNMGSTDETDMTLKELGLKYPNLYHTFVPSGAEDVNNKKLALTIGIKAAKNDILLFTEPYCKPTSNKWIEEFAIAFADNKEIVLGYNKINIKHDFAMSGFVKYDNLIHHTKFLSMAIMGKPFMGIGRNLAYKKSMFFEEKGFSSVLLFDDGEDDLFINSVASNRKVGVVVSSDSVTQTDTVDSFKVWKSLKSKYLNGKKFYKGSSSFVFWLDLATRNVFYLAVVLSIVYGFLVSNFAIVSLAVIAFVIHLSVSLFVINKLNGLFGNTKIHLNLMWYEFLYQLNNFRFKNKAKIRKRKR